MKLSVCDVCKSEGALVEASSRWRFRSKDGLCGISVDVCKPHQAWGKGRTFVEAGQVVTDAKFGKGRLRYAESVS